jgi:hypothetical protein
MRPAPRFNTRLRVFTAGSVTLPCMPMPSIVESMGLLPPRERLRQALIALRGDEDVPPAKFGLSSLRLLDPTLSVPLWRGRDAVHRKAVISNLFNHRQTQIGRAHV